MKTLFVAAALAALCSSVASGQCDPNVDLAITVSPSPAVQGQTVTVSVTNNSPTCTYTLPSGCVFQAVRLVDCKGADVTNFFCTLSLKPIGPGKTVTQDWDQLDNNGQQVQNGTYGFPIKVYDAQFTLHDLCATVDVGTTCTAPTIYGAGDSGSGGNVPSITWTGGFPSLGNGAFAIAVSNCVGGAQAAMFIGAAPANIVAPWGTFYIDPSLPMIQLNFSLSGAVGVPGAGSVLVPAPIPNVPILLNANIYVQTLIADAGSIGGISHTAGLTFTICH